MVDEVEAACIQAIATVCTGVAATAVALSSIYSWRREAPGRASVESAAKCMQRSIYLLQRFSGKASRSYYKDEFLECDLKVATFAKNKAEERFESTKKLLSELKTFTIEHSIFLNEKDGGRIFFAYDKIAKARRLAVKNRTNFIRICLQQKLKTQSREALRDRVLGSSSDFEAAWAKRYSFSSKMLRQPDDDDPSPSEDTPLSLATESHEIYKALLQPVLQPISKWRRPEGWR
jgi:hypothetical protein